MKNCNVEIGDSVLFVGDGEFPHANSRAEYFKTCAKKHGFKTIKLEFVLFSAFVILYFIARTYVRCKWIKSILSKIYNRFSNIRCMKPNHNTLLQCTSETHPSLQVTAWSRTWPSFITYNWKSAFVAQKSNRENVRG